MAQQADDLVQRFEEVAALLGALDVEAVWKQATNDERRVLVQELVEEVALFRIISRSPWPVLPG